MTGAREEGEQVSARINDHRHSLALSDRALATSERRRHGSRRTRTECSDGWQEQSHSWATLASLERPQRHAQEQTALEVPCAARQSADSRQPSDTQASATLANTTHPIPPHEHRHTEEVSDKEEEDD